MNMMKKLVGLMFVCLGCATLFVACDELDESPCETNEDCMNDELCVQESCHETCDVDDDCSFAGDECVENPEGGDQNICMAGEDPGENCAFDDDCDDGVCYNGDVCVPTCENADDCGDDQVCEQRDDSDTQDQSVCMDIEPGGSCERNEDCITDEFCDIPDGETEGTCTDLDQVFYYTVLIEDVTEFETDPEDDRCSDTTHGFETAGAKIMNVILRDASDGSIVAHGATVDVNYGENANYGDAYAVLDGEDPDYDEECPNPESVTNDEDQTYDSNFHEDAVVALGCGGELFVQFPIDVSNDNYSPNVLDESYQIEVREFGKYCGDIMVDEHGGTNPPQSQDDYYDVYLCTDGSDAGIDDTTCDVQISQAAFGISLIDIDFPDPE